jgi:hypothetical protein
VLFISFLTGKGVKHIFVDTDGYCWDLIPLFLEGGATGMYPFETACGDVTWDGFQYYRRRLNELIDSYGTR